MENAGIRTTAGMGRMKGLWVAARLTARAMEERMAVSPIIVL